MTSPSPYKAKFGVGRHFDFPGTVGSNVSFKSAAQVAAASGQAGLDL